jgi:hypothetical protein
VTPSPSPSPRHSNVRPSHLPLHRHQQLQQQHLAAERLQQQFQQQQQQQQQQHQIQQQPLALPRLAGEGNVLHRLAPRNMLQSRQASNNSNQQSSMDDSGVVDDHEGDDVTSAEEHERRDQQHPHREQLQHIGKRKNPQQPQQQERTTGALEYPAPAPVTISVRTSNREIRVLKCNGIKNKKHLYSLPPEYLSHIVVIGEPEMQNNPSPRLKGPSVKYPVLPRCYPNLSNYS